jgi:BolA family transcriptional regulator, general stress-responsive regulator
MTNSGTGVVKAKIEAKIRTAFSPAQLSVIDESCHHAGHMNHHPEGETHFRVEIVSDAFVGKSRLERHRLVNSLLSDELSGRVHALAVTAKTVSEVG